MKPTQLNICKLEGKSDHSDQRPKITHPEVDRFHVAGLKKKWSEGWSLISSCITLGKVRTMVPNWKVRAIRELKTGGVRPLRNMEFLSKRRKKSDYIGRKSWGYPNFPKPKKTPIFTKVPNLTESVIRAGNARVSIQKAIQLTDKQVNFRKSQI